MVLEDPGSEAVQEAAQIAAMTEKLVADFTEIWHSTMRDVPLVNKALRVEAIGFRKYNGMIIGVLVSPWFMNLVLLPDGDDWSDLSTGAKEVIGFPSGEYEFIHNTREMTGGYKACSLFSPMGDFTSHKDATDVARAVMEAIFDPEHRAGTDRSADIRARREAELAEAEEDEIVVDPAPSRRAVITGGIAAEDGAT